jgi:signal transduction histidine kinase/AmiR/NasT family two-component response regulator
MTRRAGDAEPHGVTHDSAAEAGPYGANDGLVRLAREDHGKWLLRVPVSAIVSSFLFGYADVATGLIWLAVVLAIEGCCVFTRRRVAAGDLRFAGLHRALVLGVTLCWIAHALVLWRVGGEVPKIAAIIDLFTVSLYGAIGGRKDRVLMLTLIVPPLVVLSALLIGQIWATTEPVMASFATLATLGACGTILGNGLAMNISDRQLNRANAALAAVSTDLEEHRRFLEDVSAIAKVGGWELDLATGRIAWSSWTRHIHEVDETFVPAGAAAVAFYAPEARAQFTAAVQHAIATGTGWDLELPFDTAMGRRIIVRTIGKAERRDGATVRLIGSIKDVSERVATERQLGELAEQARRANRAKDAFLANMSHEIRTPLNGVIGLAAALVKSDLDPRQKEMAGLIHSSGETLERLLSDLLDLSKIEAEKFELRPAPFDLHDTVETAAHLMRVRADDKGVAFMISYGPNAAGRFLGDAVRVRQIVSNLASNAVKFTQAGSVAIHVDVDEPEEATAPASVRITVRDTGIGFDADTARRLFQRFEQADDTIAANYGGTGLGLAISKALVEAMGGSLRATSQPGEGSTFELVLRLPRAAAAASDLRALAGEGAAASSKAKLNVLLAEDNLVNQKVFRLLLAPFGMTLTIAPDGQAAVAAFAAGPFDLVLMDMQMPVMDGLAATAAIRALEQARGAPRTPIAMLSANAMPEHVAQAMAAGCDGHIAKPVTPQSLIEGIKRAMAASADRARAAA